jgi:hypothetical protein
VELRRAVWALTSNIRFEMDIANALHQGRAVVHDALQMDRQAGLAPSEVHWSSFLRAFAQRYDRVAEAAKNGQYHLDYPPGRLWLMSVWVKSLTRGVELPARYDDPFAAPLRWFNGVMEACASVAIGLVVTMLLRHQRYAGAWGLVAGLMTWFNPGLILLGHGWPQWDVWVVAACAWGWWFGLRRWWFAAGVVMAFGAMLKGQVLVGLPFLAFWPMFAGDWRGAIRASLGFSSAFVLLASPFLIRDGQAALLAGLVTAAFVVLLRRRGSTGYLIRGRSWFISAGLSVALVAILAGGSLNWLRVGFGYGIRHYPHMALGSTSNLATILRNNFGIHDVNLPMGPALGLGEAGGLTLRQLLAGIFGVGMVLSAWAAGRATRRGSPRLAAALVAPWALFFALNVQMHERYIFYAAILSGVMVGMSVGGVLVHLLLSGISFMHLLQNMLEFGHQEKYPALLHVLRGLQPGSAWVLLMICGILLYLALGPGRRVGAEGSVGLSHRRR